MFSRFYAAALMISLLSSVLPQTAHAAKIYHWVDDKGRSHYSENRPHDAEAKTLNVQATGKSSSGSPVMTNTSKPATKPATAKDGEQENLVTEHSIEDKAKFCQQSRDLLQSMGGNMQRRFKQPDGSFRKLEQPEIADYKAQAQAGIKNYCK